MSQCSALFYGRCGERLNRIGLYCVLEERHIGPHKTDWGDTFTEADAAYARREHLAEAKRRAKSVYR